MFHLPDPIARLDIEYQLATVALAPLLVAQGLYVRRAMMRLVEPPGARSGSDGEGPELRLLIAGDSAAAGVGASTQHEALSGQLVSALRSTFRAHWQLVAQSGYTVQDLLVRLQAAAPEPLDVALISAGVNDVTGRTRTRNWIGRQTTLIGLLKSKFGARHILLSSLPPIHVFPALPQPLRWYLGVRARQLNDMLRKIAEADDRCEFLPITFPFERRYVATDGFHPAPPAYSIWADIAAQTIRRRIGREAES